jgi:predicted HicB family RNase H-like nuclease
MTDKSLSKYTMVRIENEIHDKLKILAIIRKVSFQDIVKEAASEFVREHEDEIRNIK